MSNDIIDLLLDQIVYREDLYPRLKPDPATIQQYAEHLDLLPPIEVSQGHILIDGYHRWKAYETAGAETIPATITTVESEMHLLMLAVARNAAHRLQLSPAEKKRYAVRWWDMLSEDEICATLSIAKSTFYEWTQNRRQQRDD